MAKLEAPVSRNFKGGKQFFSKIAIKYANFSKFRPTSLKNSLFWPKMAVSDKISLFLAKNGSFGGNVQKSP